MLGFFFGIFFINLVAKETVYTVGIFDHYFLKNYTNTQIEINEYIFYLFKIRIIPFLFLFMFSFTIFKKVITIISIVWTGISSGIISSLAVMHMGIKGILLCLVSGIPHFLLYVPAYFVLLWYMYQIPQSKWTWNKSVFVVLTLFMGLILEAYVNPMLMTIFIKTL